MPSRVQKHTHLDRVISHDPVWERVLTSCSVCYRTETLTPAAKELRVRVAERKYRPASTEEFQEKMKTLRHLCCG